MDRVRFSAGVGVAIHLFIESDTNNAGIRRKICASSGESGRGSRQGRGRRISKSGSKENCGLIGAFGKSRSQRLKKQWQSVGAKKKKSERTGQQSGYLKSGSFELEFSTMTSSMWGIVPGRREGETVKGKNSEREGKRRQRTKEKEQLVS